VHISRDTLKQHADVLDLLVLEDWVCWYGTLCKHCYTVHVWGTFL